jgi:hypothetical protein
LSETELELCLFLFLYNSNSLGLQLGELLGSIHHTYLRQTLKTFRSPLLGVIGLLVVVLCSTARGQSTDGASAVGSNIVRVGDGTTGSDASFQNKRYLEEIANARIFFHSLSVGLRYEMDDPSEVGRSFQGLRRRWIAYKKDGLEMQAGNVTALYGRGLSMNAFESRPINFDSWLDGVYGSYEHSWKEMKEFEPSLRIQGIAGKLDFFDVDTTKPEMNVSARSVNVEYGLFQKKVVLGGSFVQAFTSVTESGNKTTSREVDQPELSLNIISGEFEGFFQYAVEREVLTSIRNRPDSARMMGNAMYGSLSYANTFLGLTFEYKNYKYFVHPTGVDNETYFGKLPISNPPEVYKEFTYTSITRTTHAVNFNDELGMELEANITAIPNVTITLNGAMSSRHNAYKTLTDKNGIQIAVDSTALLPKMGDLAFFPFWEAYGEVEYDLGELNYIKGFFHRRSDVIGYTPSQPGLSDQRSSTTVGAKLQYETTKSQSMLVIFEHQWMHDAASLSPDKDFLNELLTLQYSFNPTITFGGLYDFTTEHDVPRHIWPQAFVSFRIGESHTVLASYGAERGGLNCTGGICRLVPAFNGLRVTLTSQL